MTRFYTGRGDDGSTGRLGEGRISKDSPVTEAIGALDEATAALGVARALAGGVAADEAGIAALILEVQRDLYHLMAEVSATPENAARFRRIDAARVAWLEQQVDRLTGLVEMPKEFIVPGDTPGGAAAAMARTVVRRAERAVVRLYRADAESEAANPQLIRYLNRLSSLCFVLELYQNQHSGQAEQTFAKR